MGCGGPPQANMMLTETQSSFTTAEADPEVARFAPVAFQEAEEAVVRAQNAWGRGAEKAEVDHLAYIAQQRIKIAQARAARNAAQAEIETARTERQQVVLEARAVEAEAAQAEAERERAEANAARLEAERQREQAEAARAAAEAALTRAQELADRVNELEAELTNRGLVLTLSDVLFDVGEATLKPAATRTVDQLVTFLGEYPRRNVLIEGFTDATGSDAFNQGLSQRRADAVQAALTARGIAANRIQTRGFGEQFPKASNATDAGRQQNRRVEIIISDETGNIPTRTE